MHHDTTTARLGAWGAHLFTASGAVWGLLALLAIADGRWRAALGWMIVAVIVDAADGALARAARVTEMAPQIDGALLDNLLDYLNYVIVPAVFVARSHVVPAPMRLVAAVAIVLASAYQFSQVDAKTSDHFFKGFPSYWNVAVLYLYLGGLPEAWHVAVLLLLCCGVFVPLRWAYPTRMRRWRAPVMAVTIAWGVAVIGLVAQRQPSRWWVGLTALYVPFYMLVSLALSSRGFPEAGSTGASGQTSAR